MREDACEFYAVMEKESNTNIITQTISVIWVEFKCFAYRPKDDVMFHMLTFYLLRPKDDAKWHSSDSIQYRVKSLWPPALAYDKDQPGFVPWLETFWNKTLVTAFAKLTNRALSITSVKPRHHYPIVHYFTFPHTTNNGYSMKWRIYDEGDKVCKIDLLI